MPPDMLLECQLVRIVIPQLGHLSVSTCTGALASRHVKIESRDSPQPVYEMMAVWRWPALQAVNVATALN